MNPRALALLPLLAICHPALLRGQAASRPPIDAYLMPPSAELAMAASAAPVNVSSRATMKVLTASGYQVERTGDNGFVCMVMRGWTAPMYTPSQLRDLVYDPSVRAPICFDPRAAQTVLPYYELRTRLGMEGRSPDQIARVVESAYARGELPKREGVSFAYMWSADQYLAPGIGHWHPHMMVFSPYYENAMVGGHAFGPPLPIVSDDGGTPFAVVVIPVDDKLALRMTSDK